MTCACAIPGGGIKMEISNGLEDIYIKNTALTSIDGEKGILRYRGYDIKDLVEKCSYEEVSFLMLFGELPDRRKLAEFTSSVQKGYVLPEFTKRVISALPEDADALSVFETAFASLSCGEDGFVWSRENVALKAPEALGRASAVVAAAYRHMAGKELKLPEPTESYARSFLQACFDGAVDKRAVTVMNRALVLYADHEVPASTTAAIVSCSTLSDMYSSIAAAIAALKGPLHGGAAEAAYSQFEDIGSPENVDHWFQTNVVEGKRRLMGFGHRVYRTYDPRMAIFKSMAIELSTSDEDRQTLEIAEKLEKLGVERFSPKHIFPNTDFYSGVAFKGIGFPLHMFTALFALSRTVGWIAHMSEYVENGGRIMRPRANYTGPDARVLQPVSHK